jgi:hypothetical protein
MIDLPVGMLRGETFYQLDTNGFCSISNKSRTTSPSADANPNLIDRNRHRPLALAKARGYADTLALIGNAGGK